MTSRIDDQAQEGGIPAPRRPHALAAVLAAVAMVVLDGAITNVALPNIAGSLNVSPSAAVWVVTGYQLALVMAILPCGALGESLGYRRVFTGGTMVFTAASALCALAPSLPWLVAARFAQGLGGAALMALGTALLRFTFPRHRLGAVIGWNAMTVALAGAAGPSLGAAIMGVSSWPWLFAVNLPVGAVVLLLSRALPRPAGHGRRLDGISVALNGATFAALVLGAELLAARPWRGAALLAVGLGCLAGLVRREMPRTAPLIPLDLLRGASFRISVMASVLCFAGQMASYIALPFYLQHGLGQDVITTGLYMTPWPLTVAFAGPVYGRLSDRVPTAWLCAAGGLGIAAGLALACSWPLHGHKLPLVAFTALSGLGFGCFQVANNRNMFTAAPLERSGAAGGMQGTARLAGQTAGGVIMTILFALLPVAAAPRIGLAVAAGLAGLGGLVSLLRVQRAQGAGRRMP